MHSALPPSELPPNQSGEVAGQPSELANAKVAPADFLLLRVVGQGAFGKVCVLAALVPRTALPVTCFNSGLSFVFTRVCSMMSTRKLWQA